jgi:hypothetical protein
MIDSHSPGYVDAYFGPPELNVQNTTDDPPPLELLDELAASLGQSITTDPDLTPERRTFLEAEWQAMHTTIQILKGNAPNIVDEVRLLYGVTPDWVDERFFEDAHHTLNEILPGSEPLAKRVQAFRERSRVPVAAAASIIHPLMENFRGRARHLFNLPSNETCEISFVTDVPWRAYNWYQGKGQSRIEFNQDLPLEMWDIPTTVAHETYPGHHTERVLKENNLYLGEGRLENAIALSNTPSALISEGIAANALLALVPEDEIATILLDCYERAGLSRQDALHAPAFMAAYRQLESVVDNQVLLLYRDKAPEPEVMAYGMRYALTNEEDEAHTLRFIQDPLSRSYTYNYTLGRQLIAAYLDRVADKRRAFQRLLAEPLTPAQIREFSIPTTGII